MIIYTTKYNYIYPTLPPPTSPIYSLSCFQLLFLFGTLVRPVTFFYVSGSEGHSLQTGNLKVAISSVNNYSSLPRNFQLLILLSKGWGLWTFSASFSFVWDRLTWTSSINQPSLIPACSNTPLAYNLSVGITGMSHHICSHDMNFEIPLEFLNNIFC